MATLARLLKLVEASELVGIPVKTLRAEVHAGRLRCFRARPSCNAPILLREADVNVWLETVCAARQLAPAPGA